MMYKPTGVCSQVIDVTADENDVIQQVFFIGMKRTSCPDQLSEALKELKNTPLED